MIWGVTWLPIVFVGVPLPASALSPETRARYIAGWAHSKSYLVREGFFLLKAIALMGWGAQGSVRLRLGVGPLAAAGPSDGGMTGPTTSATSWSWAAARAGRRRRSCSPRRGAR